MQHAVPLARKSQSETATSSAVNLSSILFASVFPSTRALARVCATLLFIFSSQIQALPIEPNFTYRSYADQPLFIDPSPLVHLSKYNEVKLKEFLGCFERISNSPNNTGYCMKLQGLSIAPDLPQRINTHPVRYVTHNMATEYHKQPGGSYYTRVRYDVNNLAINLLVNCPVGSSLQGPDDNKYCDCLGPSCITDELNGPPTPNTCSAMPPAGNPINTSNGNKYQKEVDFSPASPAGIEFYRSYNSSNGLWLHNYSDYLSIGARGITLHESTGRKSYFIQSGASLTGSSIETGVLIQTQSGYEYLAENNTRLLFGQEGQLVSKQTPGGIKINVSQSNGAIELADSFGNTAALSEDEQRQPLAFSTQGASFVYTYNAASQLEKVVKSQSLAVSERIYHYEDIRNSKLLTGITDEKGIRFASWSYDEKFRAITSEHANGTERTSLSYNSDGSTTITNELGKITKYKFYSIDGVKRLAAIEGEPSANCPLSNSRFSYDERGRMKTKMDNRGGVTTYSYNARGLESSRTEAAGTAQARAITTEWHPTLFLPTVVIEPKRITRYRYDNQGRQLSRTVEER